MPSDGFDGGTTDASVEEVSVASPVDLLRAAGAMGSISPSGDAGPWKDVSESSIAPVTTLSRVCSDAVCTCRKTETVSRGNQSRRPSRAVSFTRLAGVVS